MQQAENMQPADHLEPAATQSLDGRRVAVLMTDGVEQVEYTKPRQFLEAQGVTVVLISPKKVGEQIQGFNHLEPGDKYAVELNVEDANADDYDLLLLPGGVANPDICARARNRSPSSRPLATATSRLPRSATARGR